MFWLIAAVAVVPNVDSQVVQTWDIQQVVEEQVQQEELLNEVQEKDSEEGLEEHSDEWSGENLDEIQEEIEQQMLQEIMVHNWYASDSVIQNYVNYAYSLWWIDFVKLIECENGRWDPKRVSKTRDFWLCQLNYRYNKKFINSPEFADPYKQLDYCYEKYKINPKLRYWPRRKIGGKKCSDYVSNRFSIFVTYNNLVTYNDKTSENIN